MIRSFRPFRRSLAAVAMRAGCWSAGGRFVALARWPDDPLAVGQQRLAELLQHARDNVPFYADRIQGVDRRQSADPASVLEQIPVTTKDDVEAHFPDQITDGSDPADWRLMSTRGTAQRLITIHGFAKRDAVRAANLRMLCDSGRYRVASCELRGARGEGRGARSEERGAGALIGITDSLAPLKPLIYGGHMVDQVSLDGYSLRPVPERFEAGTPAIESVIGWGAALKYLSDSGVAAMSAHLDQLTGQLVQRLNQMPAVTVLGPSEGQPRGPLVSFTVDKMEALAVAKILNQRDSIFVRSGFHCAQALHEHLGIPTTVRASLQIYNQDADLERFFKALRAATLLSAM